MSKTASTVTFDTPGEGLSDRLSKLGWVMENLGVFLLCIVAAVIVVIAIAHAPKIIGALSKH